jgi:hypothetical protein
MNTPDPHASPVSPARRRRRWPWVVGLCLAPVVILGIAALNLLSLNRDAATLRRHVMKAADANWKTRVQISVGGMTLGAVRAGLAVVKPANVEQARVGLQAVSRASVGVYQCDSAVARVAPEQLMADTDRGMRSRGWTRVIGVFGKGETVLVYVPAQAAADDEVDVCLAVMKARELVIVSARLEADALGELVRQHLPGELGGKWHSHLRTAAR